MTKSLYDPTVVENTKREVVIKAIKKSMTNEDIRDLTDFSIEEIEKIRQIIKDNFTKKNQNRKTKN